MHQLEFTVAIVGEKMAAGSRVDQWGWREVERFESDLDGRDRKKMAIGRAFLCLDISLEHEHKAQCPDENFRSTAFHGISPRFMS